jgi:hypothetical protein
MSMVQPDKRTDIVAVLLGLVGGGLMTLSVIFGVIIVAVGTALLIWVGWDWAGNYHRESHPFIRTIVQRIRYVLFYRAFADEVRRAA